ncbi:amphi-Trp domain-containing protein [Haloprofundus halobius]|uniref:amphi-Trp domain-containing protein n=1 Tax=Haloprofundus halobius TaxID=2876194 RepID=UPI001CCF4143|nr:amphi-Trp domain-containing protein [Haloprofundus halobius]
MVDVTLDAEEMSREDVAARPEELAQELREGDAFDVRVGNKTVTLNPRESLAFELSVRERSAILRGNRETVSIRMDWKSKYGEPPTARSNRFVPPLRAKYHGLQ